MGAMELRLFEALRARPGQVVPIDELIEVAECRSANPGLVVRIMLSRIRGRFRDVGLADPIRALYRRGYVLDSSALAIPVQLSAKSVAMAKAPERAFS